MPIQRRYLAFLVWSVGSFVVSCMYYDALQLPGVATAIAEKNKPTRVLPPALNGLGLPSAKISRDVFLETPFSDRREHPTTCGTAAVSCSVPPAQWMADAVGSGLASVGYRVLSTDVGAPSRVSVQGEILQFFLEQKDLFEADLSIELTVNAPSGSRARRRFHVKAVENGFQDAAYEATTDAVNRIVTAIVQLLDNQEAGDAGAPAGSANWTFLAAPTAR